MEHLAVIDGFFTRASGYQFYNTSKFTFETLLADLDNMRFGDTLSDDQFEGLKYLIECLVKQGYIDVACNKATIPHFTKDKLANVPFVVFPLQEQKKIAQYLDKKCSDIDAIISYYKI